MEKRMSENGPWFPKDMSSEERDLVRCLILAAKNGHKETVVEILESGKVNIDSKYRWETALMAAARTNNTSLCRVLLNNGADCNISRFMQQTPLWIAACHGNINVMKMMLEIGTCAQRNLNNALSRCVAMQFLSACEILLEAGADVQTKDSAGFTTLHLAAGGSAEAENEVDIWKSHNPTSWELYSSTSFDIAELLIMWNADVNAVNSEKCTPLHYACETGNETVIRLLVDNKADVNAAGGDLLKTPLHVLVNNNHPNLIEMFLENPNIRPNITDSENDTPLMTAIRLYKKECVRIFLTNEKWAEVMSVVCRGNLVTDKCIDTPMRQLIRHMPGLACYVMSKCIELSSHKDPKSPDFLARFNLFLVEDTYTSTYWKRASNDSKPVTSKLQIVTNGEISESRSAIAGLTVPDQNNEGTMIRVTGTENIPLQRLNSWSYNGSKEKICAAPACDQGLFRCSEAENSCIARKTAKPYTNNWNVVLRNHPLYIAQREKCGKVISHPLSVALINHKWKKFGRYRFYGTISMHLIFVALLTTHFILMDNQRIKNNSTVTTKGINSTESISSNNVTYFIDILTFVIVALCCLGLIAEMFAMVTNFPSYFFVFKHWLDVSVYLIAVTIIFDDGALHHILIGDEYVSAAICVFTAWFSALLAARRMPVVGIYFIMFLRIVKKSCIVLVIFLPLIFGFAFTFAILLDFVPLFNEKYTIATILAMLSGEVEFKDNLMTGGKINPKLKQKEITISAYVFFIVLMVICLLNLLVGLAVSDVETLRKKSKSEMMSLRAEHVLTTEYYLSFIPKKFPACGCLRYKPNKMHRLFTKGRKLQKIRRAMRNWFNVFDINDSRVGAKNLIRICRKEQEDESLDQLQKEIASLKVKMDDLSNTQSPWSSSTIKRSSRKIYPNSQFAPDGKDTSKSSVHRSDLSTLAP